MKLIEHFFGLLAPNHCLVCGSEGSVICSWCLEEALPEVESRCYKCDKLTNFGAVCPSCRHKTPLNHVFIRAEYMGPTKELVHAMKFSYSGEAADLIARELLSTIPALPTAER